jgi:uncharacterized protein (DUF433 family)
VQDTLFCFLVIINARHRQGGRNDSRDPEKGKIEPVDELPEHWREGQELIVEGCEPSDDPADIKEWHAKLVALSAQSRQRTTSAWRPPLPNRTAWRSNGCAGTWDWIDAGLSSTPIANPFLNSLRYHKHMTNSTHTVPGQPNVPVIAEHIEVTPGVCGGKPRIAGHRIRVQDVVFWHRSMGMRPEEIVASYQALSLSDVYAALAYYHDHQEKIDADVRAAEEAYQRLQAKQPSLVEKTAAKIGAARTANASGYTQLMSTLSSTALIAYVRSGLCSPEDLEFLRASVGPRLTDAPDDPEVRELEVALSSISKQ